MYCMTQHMYWFITLTIFKAIEWSTIMISICSFSWGSKQLDIFRSGPRSRLSAVEAFGYSRSLCSIDLLTFHNQNVNSEIFMARFGLHAALGSDLDSMIWHIRQYGFIYGMCYCNQLVYCKHSRIVVQEGKGPWEMWGYQLMLAFHSQFSSICQSLTSFT